MHVAAKSYDIEARVIAGRIYIKSPYSMKKGLESIPTARWSPQYRMWHFAATPAVAARLTYMLDIYPNYTKHTNEAFESLVHQAFEVSAAANCKDAEDLPQPKITKLPAWQHQLQAYHFVSNLPSAMLYMGMGTGKSKVAIDTIINKRAVAVNLATAKNYSRILIICPKSVMAVWPEQFARHAGNNKYAILPLVKGSVAKKVDTAENFLKLQEVCGKQAIVVCNYEMVWRPPFDSWAINFAKFDLVICDESHRIKAAGSKVSRYLSRLGDKVPHRLCLTGTPMPNGPLDIYGQYRFLDKGVFGTSYTKFKARYAITRPVGSGGNMVVGYINQQEMQDKIYSIAYHAGRDVLDLPEAVHVIRHVKLSAKTRRVYTELEKEFYALVQEKEVSISNALTKLLRLQQICSGFVPADDGTMLRTGAEKFDTLVDIFEDLDKDEPVVVFCRFRRDLGAVHEAATKTGRTCAELSGRENQLARWQAGRYNVLAVQIQAGGVGVDLTRAHYCVYYSVGHSLGDYEQSLARVHRPGQERTTFYIHIVAAKTVDEKVYKALDSKKKIIEEILGEGK